MVFSSIGFLFRFLPIFIILYVALPKYRNIILLLGSLIFYGVGEPYFVLLLLLSVLVNFALSRYMFWEPRSPQTNRKKKAARRKKIALASAVVFDLGILFLFKYWDFAAENINTLAGKGLLPLLSLTLPLGISFYTFQMLSYLIDCYYGTVENQADLLTFATYVCMFPQLIAGPIVVYSDISNALKKRALSARNIESGLKTFIVGLGCKVIIANQIGTLWNEVCTIGFESISTPLAWLGAFGYSMQLYFDFCGYSIMAIGLGEMLGFKMPINFNYPYISRSVTEFWRRWHMTLGAWFREYVYIPLGGNRKGKLRTYLNLFVVWLLVGFWHGASWNFVIWGLLIFVLLVVEKGFLLKFLNHKNIFSWAVSHLYVFIYILVSWAIFAITDFSELGVYLTKMFPIYGISESASLNDFERLINMYAPLLAASVIFSSSLPKKLWNRLRDSILGTLILLGVFWYCIYLLAMGVNNPFMYFRF